MSSRSNRLVCVNPALTADDIVRVFNGAFSCRYNTRLMGGGSEPEYLPANAHRPAQIVFREDYAASALHEIAHWCIAGPQRRELVDYGYWYEQQRDQSAQRRFETAEARPQGLEWILSNAAGIPFRVSCDNFSVDALDLDGFRTRVRSAALDWLARGLPGRALKIADQLSAAAGNAGGWLHADDYKRLPK